MSEFNENGFMEIRNFFDDPDLIRNIGLHCNYQKCNFLEMNGIWSGLRSPMSYEVIGKRISSKIELESGIKIKNVSYSFHINPSLSCLGGPHNDSKDEKAFAGVIYLSDNVPEDIPTGTTLYFDPAVNDLENQPMIYDMQIMYSLELPSNHPQKIRAKEKFLQYKNTLNVRYNAKNEYNKLVMYYSNIYHSPDFYFGENIYDSRMTIVFHGKME